MLTVEQVKVLTGVAVVSRTDPMFRVRIPFLEIGVQTTSVVDFGAIEHAAKCDDRSCSTLCFFPSRSDKFVTKETVLFKRGRGLNIASPILVPVRIERIVTVSLFVLETISKAAV